MPNNDCTKDCYGIVDDVYRWFISNNSIYITLKNLNTNKKELIKINDNISLYIGDSINMKKENKFLIGSNKNSLHLKNKHNFKFTIFGKKLIKKMYRSL